MNTRRKSVALAGTILFLGAAAAIIIVHIAEAMTPGYSTAAETISGIGSTLFSSMACFAAHCNAMYQPASVMLISLFWVLGLVLVFVAVLIHQASTNYLVSRTLALFGLDAILVGVSYVPLYGAPSDAALTFAFIMHNVTGGILLIVLPAFIMFRAHTFTHAPFSYVSWFCGCVILIAAPVYAYMMIKGVVAGPGFGGVERILIYTWLTWFAGFGAYLMAAPDALLTDSAAGSR